jgi:hypothetical protein
MIFLFLIVMVASASWAGDKEGVSGIRPKVDDLGGGGVSSEGMSGATGAQGVKEPSSRAIDLADAPRTSIKLFTLSIRSWVYYILLHN